MEEQPKNVEEQPKNGKSISKALDGSGIAGYTALLFTLISAAFYGGIVFQTAKIDREKKELDEKVNSQSEKIDRLYARIRNDSISRNNWMLLNTNNLYFNTDSSALNTLTVNNVSVSPCVRGNVDGCWDSIITAKVGDTIAIQIRIRNTGDLEVKDVIVGCSYEPLATGQGVHVAGGIAVGNLMVVRGDVTILTPKLSTIVFLPGLTSSWAFPDVSRTVPLKRDDTFPQPSFNIGTIKPVLLQGVVMHFAVTGL